MKEKWPEADEQQGNLPQYLIPRINQWPRNKKAPGLTPQQPPDQTRLREDYLARFRANFRSQVEMLQVYDKNGKEVTPEKVKQIQRDRGLRDD